MRSHRNGTGVAAFIPAIGLILVSTVALAAVHMQPPRGAGDQVAVIFAPGTSLTEAVFEIAAADGRVLRTGAFSNIVVATGWNAGFVQRLSQTKAWLVVDPGGLGGCLVPAVERGPGLKF